MPGPFTHIYAARRVADLLGQQGGFVAAGGRETEWRFPAALPDLLRKFDKAAGLDHRELAGRTLSLGFGLRQ